jgi:hypothetical protein
MAWTEYYVDPASGSDSTGTGTIGSPWASVQHALDTVTPSGRDRINLKAGSTDFISTYLDFTTFSPSTTNQIAIQGYTSTAGDGGMGSIDSSGGLTNTSSSGIHLINLNLSSANIGSHWGIYLQGSSSSVVSCNYEYTYNAASVPAILMGDQGSAVFDVFLNSPTTGARCGIQAEFVSRCVVKLDGNSSSGTISTVGKGGWPGTHINNIYWITGNHAGDVVSVQAKSVVAHNTIFSQGSSTGKGINITNTDACVYNNYIEGFSGAGAVALSCNATIAATGNAFYNNTTNESLSFDAGFAGKNLSLSSSALSDPGSGDFNVDATVKDDAFNSGGVFRGLSTTKCELNYGAAISQAAPSGGGGATVHPLYAN